jgi:O-antigen ligase
MTGSRLDRYDRVGLALVAIFAGWSVLSAVVAGGNPWPPLALTAAATAVYAGGRTWGSRDPVLVSALIVFGILVSVVVAGPRAISGSPLAPVLGYANANAALYTLGVVAATIIATFADRRFIRWLGAVLALAMLALAVINTSQAAVVLAIAVLLAALTARWLGRWVALVAPLLVLAAIATTVVLGATHGTATLAPLEEELTERRTVLWQEALDIVAAEPVFGVGPGGFAETSPTALADADARWAHSAYLEVAAETGVPGLVLLLALLWWVYGSLYRSRQDPRLVVIGTAGITALAIHAAVDYVAHFPAVVLIAAIVAGLASSRREASAPSVSNA